MYYVINEVLIIMVANNCYLHNNMILQISTYFTAHASL